MKPWHKFDKIVKEKWVPHELTENNQMKQYETEVFLLRHF
jgi:hypothetical protein